MGEWTKASGEIIDLLEGIAQRAADDILDHAKYNPAVEKTIVKLIKYCTNYKACAPLNILAKKKTSVVFKDIAAQIQDIGDAQFNDHLISLEDCLISIFDDFDNFNNHYTASEIEGTKLNFNGVVTTIYQYFWYLTLEKTNVLLTSLDY